MPRDLRGKLVFRHWTTPLTISPAGRNEMARARFRRRNSDPIFRQMCLSNYRNLRPASATHLSVKSRLNSSQIFDPIARAEPGFCPYGLLHLRAPSARRGSDSFAQSTEERRSVLAWRRRSRATPSVISPPLLLIDRG